MKKPSIVDTFKSNITTFIIYGIFVILLIALLVIGLTTTDATLKNLLLGVSSSLLASLIIGFIPIYKSAEASHVATLIKEEADRIIAFHDNNNNKGIKRLKLSNDIDKEFWTEIIQSSLNVLDLLGHGLDKWLKDEYRKDFSETIERVLRNKGSVRILINKYICEKMQNCRDRYCITNTDHLKTETKEFINLINTQVIKSIQDDHHLSTQQKQDYLNKLEVKWNNHEVFYNSYIRTDTMVFVSPYLSFPDSTIVKLELLLKKDAILASSYINDFNKLFNLDTSTYITKNTNGTFDIDKTIKSESKHK